MRLTSALMLLALMLPGWFSFVYPPASSAMATSALAAEVFPYVMLASADKTPVRAMPNRQLELTDELRQGAPVEVYKHGDDGWLAIRPLFGHFSWVETKHIKMTGVQNIGEVTTDGVEAWIGSRFTDARLATQVKLKLGERVEVLETRRLTAPNGSSELWSRIMPPDGEFRWVEAKDFYRSGSKPPLIAPQAVAPLTAAPLADAPLAPAPLTTSPAITPSPAPLVLEPATKETAPSTTTPAELTSPSPATTAAEPMPALAPLPTPSEIKTPAPAVMPEPATIPAKPEGWVATEAKPSEGSAPAVSAPTTPAVTPMVSAATHEGNTPPISGQPTPATIPPSVSATQPAEATPGNVGGTAASPPANLPASNVGGKPEPTKAFANEAEFIGALEAIDLDLSMMASQPPATWQLENLKLRAAAMSEAATSPFQRGRTRLMLDKLGQFADIQTRHEKLKTYQPVASRMPSGRLAFLSPPADAPPSASRIVPRGGIAPAYTPNSANPTGASGNPTGAAPPGRFTPAPSAAPATLTPAPLTPFPTTPISTTPVTPATPPATWRAAGSSNVSTPIVSTPAASGAAPFSTPLAVSLPSPAPNTSAANAAAPNTAVNSPPSLHSVYSGLDPQFDGTGWLVPTVSRREDIPRFMLVDEQGKLIQFVSPSPGVYLQRFVRTRVGIYGQRGFSPEFGKPHLTAERVTVLEGTKR